MAIEIINLMSGAENELILTKTDHGRMDCMNSNGVILKSVHLNVFLFNCVTILLVFCLSLTYCIVIIEVNTY